MLIYDPTALCIEPTDLLGSPGTSYVSQELREETDPGICLPDKGLFNTDTDMPDAADDHGFTSQSGDTGFAPVYHVAAHAAPSVQDDTVLGTKALKSSHPEDKKPCDGRRKPSSTQSMRRAVAEAKSAGGGTGAQTGMVASGTTTKHGSSEKGKIASGLSQKIASKSSIPAAAVAKDNARKSTAAAAWLGAATLKQTAVGKDAAAEAASGLVGLEPARHPKSSAHKDGLKRQTPASKAAEVNVPVAAKRQPTTRLSPPHPPPSPPTPSLTKEISFSSEHQTPITPPMADTTRPGFSPIADSDPFTPVASSPAPPSPTAGGPTPAVSQTPKGTPRTPESPVTLTARLMLNNDICGTMSFPAPAGMTVLSVWDGLAPLLGLPQGCVSHALCNSQLAQAEQTLAALGSQQAVQLDFILHLQGPHLVQLTMRDCAQTAVPASFLQSEMLGLALLRWAARMNLPLSHLQFAHQGRLVNWGAKVEDHGFPDGAVLDVAVVDCSSPSAVPGCGHPGGGLDKVANSSPDLTSPQPLPMQSPSKRPSIFSRLGGPTPQASAGPSPSSLGATLQRAPPSGSVPMPPQSELNPMGLQPDPQLSRGALPASLMDMAALSWAGLPQAEPMEIFASSFGCSKLHQASDMEGVTHGASVSGLAADSGSLPGAGQSSAWIPQPPAVLIQPLQPPLQVNGISFGVPIPAATVGTSQGMQSDGFWSGVPFDAASNGGKTVYAAQAATAAQSPVKVGGFYFGVPSVAGVATGSSAPSRVPQTAAKTPAPPLAPHTPVTPSQGLWPQRFTAFHPAFAVQPGTQQFEQKQQQQRSTPSTPDPATPPSACPCNLAAGVHPPYPNLSNPSSACIAAT
ncbi:TPA: hypothetical protein ACH3X2_007978 [Trebouxia sp. C0005]